MTKRLTLDNIRQRIHDAAEGAYFAEIELQICCNAAPIRLSPAEFPEGEDAASLKRRFGRDIQIIESEVAQ